MFLLLALLGGGGVKGVWGGGEGGVLLRWSHGVTQSQSSGSADIWKLCPSVEPGTGDSSSFLSNGGEADVT